MVQTLVVQGLAAIIFQIYIGIFEINNKTTIKYFQVLCLFIFINNLMV